MFDLDLTLKGNEVFLVGRSADGTGLSESGLYLRDTRFLHRFDLRIDDSPLDVLSVHTSNGRFATINMANPGLQRSETPRHTIGIEQRIEIDGAMTVQLELQNFRQSPVELLLSLDLAADFRDMFDVRGWKAPRRGSLLPTEITEDSVRLAMDSLDRTVISSTVLYTPAPTRIASGELAEATVYYDVTLAPGEQKLFAFVCTPDPADGRPVSGVASAGTDAAFAFWSNNAELQQLLDQSDNDLALLQTDFPEGSIPAAGIPWYIAPFGRDSLIVGLQTMHVYPERIASTLRVLAAHQGKKVDEFQEEQPGKILHEVRYGEMARSKQIPHTPYFGSIDATPLFVLTFAQHYLWHRDEQLWDDLIGNVRAALDWIESYGDLDGDGLIEYSGVASGKTHISQQGWKDSWDSLHHADGSEVTGPIALVEVQGYVFAAYSTLAQAATIRGETEWSKELSAKAERVRRIVEDRFWLEDEGYYAQALDGTKRPVGAIASNPGHLLFCELPSPSRAQRIAERMMRPDLYAGWGIRTLSSNMPTYNPMSYHNGSIWPHDTSLAMAGFRLYDQDAPAIQLALGLVTLGYFAPESRLAELYCGYALDGHEDGPVNYPVSCIPRAWAAGSAHLVLRTLLGLKPDFVNKSMIVDPFLPPQFEAIGVANLAAFGERFDLSVHVDDDHYHVSPVGGVNVIVAGGEENNQSDA